MSPQPSTRDAPLGCVAVGFLAFAFVVATRLAWAYVDAPASETAADVADTCDERTSALALRVEELQGRVDELEEQSTELRARADDAEERVEQLETSARW